MCQNTHGSHACQCRKGWTGNGRDCSGNYDYFKLKAGISLAIPCSVKCFLISHDLLKETDFIRFVNSNRVVSPHVSLYNTEDEVFLQVENFYNAKLQHQDSYQGPFRIRGTCANQWNIVICNRIPCWLRNDWTIHDRADSNSSIWLALALVLHFRCAMLSHSLQVWTNFQSNQSGVTRI